MKLLTLIKAKKYGSPKKMILLVLFPIALVGILLQIIWSYHNLEDGWGASVANIVIAYHVVFLLMWVVAGIGVGLGIDRLIRLQKSIFHHPQKGGWVEACMNLWGYEVQDQNLPAPTHECAEAPQMIEPFDLFTVPARRGRKPTFPLERWLPIAAQWENRDPIRDAFTLGEVIAEHLGTNSDGSPIVSEQTYYSVWRQRAIEELQRRAKSRKTNSTREIKRELT